MATICKWKGRDIREMNEAELREALASAIRHELVEALRAVITNHCGNSDRMFCGTCSHARELLARIDGDAAV